MDEPKGMGDGMPEGATTDVPIETRYTIRPVIEGLTRHQFKLLKRLANSPVKVYCMPAGIDSDLKRDEVNVEFNGVLRLVQLGLMSDASLWPKYEGLVSQHRDESGRDVVIVVLNKSAQKMFERVIWERRVN
jgi:hypothetical protein